MKKLAIVTLLLLSLFQIEKAVAQESDSLSFIDIDVRKNAVIYQLAMKFNDPSVARMALYNILFYSNNQSSVLDSLAMMYYNMNQMPSVALVTTENLKINPDNEIALEMGAIALNQLGAKDKALDNYEKLFLKNDNSGTLYQMILIQFELKKFNECATSISILLQKTDIDELKIKFGKVDKGSQEVSLRSATLNIKGLLAQENGDIQAAKESFLEAIKATPGFELAQLNLSKAGK